ncbi:hypothetical protein EVB41_043 [Rhizobium phage RHph_TM3_14A]|nr:hypothetical protein EVB29_043 [Rhizobium phage RHph_TM27A]QIG66963.1 hypothetical protein EVB30_043 [Rhizobium phage RHph_TM27B]QIG67052.1 hypothetical protein EVB31_042 [Rhizobium phage RHph_TM29]QIG67508.1 hypothetical protein EVB41_043 [Rhizobium phage RHph_TM3_14A]
MSDLGRGTPMTEEEHIARAMLLGMRYHHGNGDPFYYKSDADGTIDPSSMVDAETLKPFVDIYRQDGFDFEGLMKRDRLAIQSGLPRKSNRRWHL